MERIYAECRDLFIVMLNVIMLSIVMLSVVMLNVGAPKQLPKSKKAPKIGFINKK